MLHVQIQVGKSLCLQKPHVSENFKAILTDKLFHSAETHPFYLLGTKNKLASFKKGIQNVGPQLSFKCVSFIKIEFDYFITINQYIHECNSYLACMDPQEFLPGGPGPTVKTLKLACLDMHVLRFMRKVDSSENVFCCCLF